MPLLSRDSLHCPGCGYDVERTLRDGFATCPECGQGISEDSCRVDQRVVPQQWLWVLVPCWMSPSITLLVAIVTSESQWAAVLSGGFVLCSLLIVFLACWHVERYLDPLRPAWRSAVTSCIHGACWLILNMMALGPLAPVAMAFR